jgi:uncharacterized protein YcsI (UPF0317 family)
MTLAEFRMAIREGQWRKPTAGCCPGFTQLNLTILPAAYAEDFQAFCALNPQPCPVLEVVRNGSYEPIELAPGADLRTDLPLYRVFDGSRFAYRENLLDDWREDLVSFLIGCSFTFEQALISQNIPIRHIQLKTNVPMYITNIDCKPAGVFYGKMVVSMRPIPRDLVQLAYDVTACYPGVHGAPVHHGDPAAIGIGDLGRPHFGDAVPVYDGEVPVFWACGVTPQVALANAKPDFAITHAPGYMFISDRRDTDFYVPPAG